MNPIPAYHGLAARHAAFLKAVSQRAVQAVALERLYLLRLTTVHHCTDSLFTAPAISCTEVTHVYLLAVPEKEGGVGLYALQDKLETHLPVPATVVVPVGATFTRWLAEGHPFACRV